MSAAHRLLQNTFEVQTRLSHVNAYQFLTDSMDKLRGSTHPQIVPISNSFFPFYTSYSDLNIKWIGKKASYKSSTQRFVEAIKQLDKKLPEWEGKVRYLFPENTAEEVAIFPKKRNLFLRGTYEQRVQAISTLSKKLQNLSVSHPSLTVVYEDVRDYYTLCFQAREKQQQNEGALAMLGSEREAQRIITMNAYLGLVYCGLGQLHYNNLNALKAFMDLSLLYKKAKKKE